MPTRPPTVITPDPDITDKLSTTVAISKQIPWVDMNDAADVSGGGTTQPGVGFVLRDSRGKPIAEELMLEFAVFSDAACSKPSTRATLDTASKGTILDGAGTAALRVKTNTSGEFQCTLTNPFDETVYLACHTTFGGGDIWCTETDSIAFS